MSKSRMSPFLMLGAAFIIVALAWSLVMVPLEDEWTEPAPDFNADGTSDGTYSITVQFMDAAGDQLIVQPFELVQNGGGSADSILIYASWNVDGFKVDWTTLSVAVTCELREYDPNSMAYEVIASGSDSGVGQVSGVYFYVYASDLAAIDDGAEHELTIVCDFTASVTNDDGELITDTDTMGAGGIMVTIAQAYINVAGTVTYDSDFNVIAFSAVDLGLNPITNPAMATLVIGFLLVVLVILPKKR